jgi:hypothetical protein
MLLTVNGNYACRGIVFTPGVVEVDSILAAWLLADAPGTFTVSEPIIEPALEAPPVDRMVKAPPVAKGSRRRA